MGQPCRVAAEVSSKCRLRNGVCRGNQSVEEVQGGRSGRGLCPGLQYNARFTGPVVQGVVPVKGRRGGVKAGRRGGIGLWRQQVPGGSSAFYGRRPRIRACGNVGAVEGGGRRGSAGKKGVRGGNAGDCKSGNVGAARVVTPVHNRPRRHAGVSRLG